jgi:hypothetical protein
VLQDGSSQVGSILGGAARKHLEQLFDQWTTQQRSNLEIKLSEAERALQAQLAHVQQDMSDFHTNQQQLLQHLQGSAAERMTGIELQQGQQVMKLDDLTQECQDAARCVHAPLAKCITTLQACHSGTCR